MGRGYGSPGISMPRMTPGIKRLMIINVVAWIIYVVMLRIGLSSVARALLLTPIETLQGLRLWQPFTYMFIHSEGAIGHLLMNMLLLFFVGPMVERMIGTRRLYTLYVLSGLGAAALTLLAAGIGQATGIGFLSALWVTPTLGASGAVYGLVLFWGARNWNQTAHLLLLGPMQVKNAIFLFIGVELLMMLSFASGTSYTAHFGGMLAGYLLGRYGLPDIGLPNLEESLRARQTRAKQKEDQKRRSRFQVIEGGGESNNDDDTAGRPIWLHRPGGDDDDPVIH